MLFFIVVSFLLGLTIAGGLLSRYRKVGNKTSLFFFLFMLSFIFAIALDSVLRYLTVTGIGPTADVGNSGNPFSFPYNLLLFLNSFWASSFIITLPLFANSLFSVEKRLFFNRLFLTLFALNIVGFIFVNLTVYGSGSLANRVVPVFWALSLATALLYCLVLFVGKFKHIQIKEVKDFIRAVALTVAIFLPVFILKEFFYIELSVKLVAKPYLIRPLLYLTINILAVVYFIKYLRRIAHYSFEDMPSEGFIKAYDLSAGEKDVLYKIMQGKTNQQIGQELFLSLLTVREHVANILKKTGVRNRSALNNLLRTHRKKFILFEFNSDAL